METTAECNIRREPPPLCTQSKQCRMKAALPGPEGGPRSFSRTVGRRRNNKRREKTTRRLPWVLIALGFFSLPLAGAPRPLHASGGMLTPGPEGATAAGPACHTNISRCAVICKEPGTNDPDYPNCVVGRETSASPSGPTPILPNQNLHVNKVPRGLLTPQV